MNFFFLSNVFWQIVKRRSTEEYESIPYVCKLLNAFFWIYYGLIKPNSFLIATINIFGAAVEITFLILFLTFAPPNMRVSFISYQKLLVQFQITILISY